MFKKRKDKAYIPVGFCPHCKEDMLIIIDTMTHKSKKATIKIAHCPKCDAVLNLENDFKVKYVTEKEIITMGWKREK